MTLTTSEQTVKQNRKVQFEECVQKGEIYDGQCTYCRSWIVMKF